MIIKGLPGLPNKPTYRIAEIAEYYDVTRSTVYVWIRRGMLDTSLTKLGQKRITRESPLKHRAGKFPVSNINVNKLNSKSSK
jgi:predicted site-specific integrase-resolvase